MTLWDLQIAMSHTLIYSANRRMIKFIHAHMDGDIERAQNFSSNIIIIISDQAQN